MKRISTILVVVVVLVLGATTYAAVRHHAPVHRKAPRTPAMAISAQVAGLLYPGSIRPLKLRVKNLLPHKVRALGISVRVGTPTRKCPIWAVVGGHFALRLTLPRGATRTVWASLRMLSRAPDSCQGAQIPLTFSMTLDGQP